MRRSRKRRDIHMDIAPINLIDLLLVMLIFFVTTTTFLQLKVIDLTLPSASSAKLESSDKKIVVINVDKECKIFVDSKEVVKESLVERLISLKSPTTTFRVGADEKSYHHCFVEVLDALSSAEINNIAILTRRED